MELTRTEIEEQIRNIDLILEKYDSLIQFLYKYENESIRIWDSKEIILGLSDDIEYRLQLIRENLKIV